MSDEFYVGYVPKAPPGLARSVRRYATGLFIAALLIALALLLGQASFANAKFEYGVQREYSGFIEREPYPILLAPGGSFLLVAPSKHGFIADHQGGVRLKGSLIER